MDTLPDYFPDDEQPSYVLAIPCRPVVLALSQLIPNLPAWGKVDWASLAARQQVQDVTPRRCAPAQGRAHARTTSSPPQAAAGHTQASIAGPTLAVDLPPVPAPPAPLPAVAASPSCSSPSMLPRRPPSTAAGPSLSAAAHQPTL